MNQDDSRSTTALSVTSATTPPTIPDSSAIQDSSQSSSNRPTRRAKTKAQASLNYADHLETFLHLVYHATVPNSDHSLS